jgi:hypothetical protein
MTIRRTRWGKLTSHEMPIGGITSVIVRRKSVMPFATLTALGAIVTVVMRFNLLWFLVDLSAPAQTALSILSLIATVLCAIPAISRALFVDIVISQDGEPESFIVRLVPQHQGRALVRQFGKPDEGT